MQIARQFECIFLYLDMLTVFFFALIVKVEVLLSYSFGFTSCISRPQRTKPAKLHNRPFFGEIYG